MMGNDRSAAEFLRILQQKASKRRRDCSPDVSSKFVDVGRMSIFVSPIGSELFKTSMRRPCRA